METTHQELEGYVCPYCGCNASANWVTVVEEKELIDTTYVGTDFGHHLYLDKYRVFKVRKCSRCDRSKKMRMRFLRYVGRGTLACCLLGIILILLGIFLSFIPQILCIVGLGFFVGGIILGIALLIVYIIWCLCSRSRLSVTYARAKACNALI